MIWIVKHFQTLDERINHLPCPTVNLQWFYQIPTNPYVYSGVLITWIRNNQGFPYLLEGINHGFYPLIFRNSLY